MGKAGFDAVARSTGLWGVGGGSCDSCRSFCHQRQRSAEVCVPTQNRYGTIEWTAPRTGVSPWRRRDPNAIYLQATLQRAGEMSISVLKRILVVHHCIHNMCMHSICNGYTEIIQVGNHDIIQRMSYDLKISYYSEL